MSLKHTFILSFFSIFLSGYGQESAPRLELRGYLSNMQSVMINDVKGDWIADNLIHNRLNFYWYPTSNLTATIQLRNRFMYGQSLQLFDGYAKSIDHENNFLDLSLNILEGKSFLLNSSVDRLYFQYTLDKFVFTAGRQRINWGQSFAWNPNDIFNVQNFFDFDYVEKPGSDALRLQYYPDYASTVELAAKLDVQDKLTIAGYYKFNLFSYDFQFLGGVLAEEDYVAGFGWSGDIKGAGFRGESSYFHPVNHFKDTTGILYTTISADYTFNNSLYVQAECLYSVLPENFSINSFLEYYQGPLTVKKLSFSKWNYFTQASYPVTPLLNMSVAGMYFPDLKGYYAGPSVNYSLKDNAELSVISQVFSGKFPDPLGGTQERTTLIFGFIRYKFSF